MTDYTDVPWDQGVEDPLAPKGQHMMVISSADEKMSKGDPEKGSPQRRMLELMVEVDGGDYAPIFHYIVFPNKDEIEFADEKQQRANKMMIRNAKRFFAAFNITPDNFASNGVTILPGAKGRLGVTHEMYNGEPQARLVLPKL